MAAKRFPNTEGSLILPENRLSQKALICTHLLDGAPLTHIYRWYGGKYKWRFYCCGTCDCATSAVTLGEALERFPEIEGFLKTPFDCSILLYRSNHNGYWHKDILE